jgi:hypothetical protein
MEWPSEFPDDFPSAFPSATPVVDEANPDPHPSTDPSSDITAPTPTPAVAEKHVEEVVGVESALLAAEGHTEEKGEREVEAMEVTEHAETEENGEEQESEAVAVEQQSGQSAAGDTSEGGDGEIAAGAIVSEVSTAAPDVTETLATTDADKVGELAEDVVEAEAGIDEVKGAESGEEGNEKEEKEVGEEVLFAINGISSGQPEIVQEEESADTVVGEGEIVHIDPPANGVPALSGPSLDKQRKVTQPMDAGTREKLESEVVFYKRRYEKAVEKLTKIRNAEV